MQACVMADTAEKCFILPNIRATSFAKGSHDICKVSVGNLEPFAGFKGLNYPETNFVFVPC